MVTVLAKMVAGAGSFGSSAGVIALSVLESLLGLVEEGVLGMPGPSSLRIDLGVLKKTTLRKVQASTAMLDAEVRQKVAEAVRLENAVTRGTRLTPSSGRPSKPTGDQIARALADLTIAVNVLREKGGYVAVDSPALRVLRDRTLLENEHQPGSKAHRKDREPS